MLGELAEGILRRPAIALATLVAAVAVAGVIATGAPSSLPVLGSLHSGEGGPPPADVVVVVRGREDLDAASSETALEVVEAGLRSDPGIEFVRPGPVGEDGRTTAFGLVLAGDSAREREHTAERLQTSIDAGSLKLYFGGEAINALELRESFDDELGPSVALAFAATALILLAAGGWRLLVTAAVSAAAGVFGAGTLLRLLSEAIELSAAGLAVALVVGLVIGIEAALTLQRRLRAQANTMDLQVAADVVLRGAGSRLATASLCGAAAALCLLIVDVPVARAAALGGAGASLLSTAAALVAVPSLALLAPNLRTRRWLRTDRIRLRRRRALTVIAAFVAVLSTAATLGLAAPALETEPLASGSKHEVHNDGGSPYQLVHEQFGDSPGSGLGAAFEPRVPDDLIARLGVALALAALIVFAIALRFRRSPVPSLGLGLAAVLAAAAIIGQIETWSTYPQASVMVCATATLATIGTARSTSVAALFGRIGIGQSDVWRLGRATWIPLDAATLAGLAVCVLLWWASDSPRSLHQFEAAVGAGLVLDFIAIRCLLVPALIRLRR